MKGYFRKVFSVSNYRSETLELVKKLFFYLLNYSAALLKTKLVYYFRKQWTSRYWENYIWEKPEK